MEMTTVGTPALWIGFLVFVLCMLAIDLGVFHRKVHAITVKEAAGWSVAWVLMAGIFAGGVYYRFGAAKALEFTTGYVLEKALSVDNLFVFLVVFSYFSVPITYQHRILFWGVLGALLMRITFILLGTALLARFHWVLYVFGLILVYTAVKLVFQKEDEVDPEKNVAVRFFRRFVPMRQKIDGPHFIVVEDGRRYATPLLLVLAVIEVTDVIFAVDSIPAIFAVTRDPFIVFTSNIFAILGLRSMYFLLAGVMDKFHYLKLGLAAVLAFIGVKMLIVEFVKIPIGISLGVIAGLLALAIVASLIWPKREDLPHPPGETPA